MPGTMTRRAMDFVMDTNRLFRTARKHMKYLLFTACIVLAAHTAFSQSRKPATSASTPPGAIAGKVLEATNTAGYTYVFLDTGKQKVWAAAPQFTVKRGDSVSIAEAMPMRDYHSKTLNRTFDIVYFTGDVSVNGAKSVAPPSTGELPEGHPPIEGLIGKPKVDLSGIKKADGGVRVEEIFGDKSKLRGKSVTVRGKVVKYNAMIMGRNWLHIQDGTGKPGSNDLVVTTSSTAKVGDTVLVKGVVTTDKDFGSGYKYNVIIEDAHVRVE
jgi:hypothetical protein